MIKKNAKKKGKVQHLPDSCGRELNKKIKYKIELSALLSMEPWTVAKKALN